MFRGDPLAPLPRQDAPTPRTTPDAEPTIVQAAPPHDDLPGRPDGASRRSPSPAAGHGPWPLLAAGARHLVMTAALAVTLFAAPSAAQADDVLAPHTVGAYATVGAMGRGDFALKGRPTADDLLVGGRDLGMSTGGGVRVDWIGYRGYEWVGLSVNAGATRWAPRANGATARFHTLVDVTLTPRFRYAFRGGRFEIFAGVPMGLALNIPPGFVASDLSPGWGVKLGLVGGAYAFFSRSFGVAVDTGIVSHFLSHDATRRDHDDATDWEVFSHEVVTSVSLVYRFGG